MIDMKCYNVSYSTFGYLPDGRKQEFSTEEEYKEEYESFESIFEKELKKGGKENEQRQ